MNTKTESFDVDWFINFFSAIPEDRWCTGMWGHAGNRCAFGHCGVTFSDEIDLSPEATALRILFGGNDSTVTRINDGESRRYQQPTPKARILAALADIKAKQLSQQQSPPLQSSVKAELAKAVPCYHNYVMGVCLYCCSTKPVEKEAVCL